MNNYLYYLLHAWAKYKVFVNWKIVRDQIIWAIYYDLGEFFFSYKCETLFIDLLPPFPLSLSLSLSPSPKLQTSFLLDVVTQSYYYFFNSSYNKIIMLRRWIKYFFGIYVTCYRVNSYYLDSANQEKARFWLANRYSKACCCFVSVHFITRLVLIGLKIIFKPWLTAVINFFS